MTRLTSLAGAILALLGALAAGPAAAQPLWQGLEAGMTPAQVQSARPGARPSAGAPLDGFEEGLTEGGVRAAGHPWDARFYFRGEALALVALTPATPGAGYQVMFDDAVRELGEQLGPPFSCAYGDFAGKQECEWRADGRRVHVLLVTQLNTPLLEITYASAAPSLGSPGQAG